MTCVDDSRNEHNARTDETPALRTASSGAKSEKDGACCEPELAPPAGAPLLLPLTLWAPIDKPAAPPLLGDADGEPLMPNGSWTGESIGGVNECEEAASELLREREPSALLLDVACCAAGAAAG